MIEKLTFGRTGHVSSRTLFGAAALGSVTQDEADATLDILLKYGVNHIDTAASYGDAELRIGPWMKVHRKDFFLATKTGERTYQKAKEEIHRSLDRLQTDQVDLLQLHNLIDDEEWEIAFGPDGALKAAVEAKEQGLVRFIGVTGHSLYAPVIHHKSLENFDFDSVLLPCNFMLMQNSQYADDFNRLVEFAKSRNVAVQLIKTQQRRPWGDRERARATWYEPFEDQEVIDAVTHWALSIPGVFLNTVGDIHVLPRMLDAANRFDGKKPAESKIAELISERDAEPLWA
jgi:aryl-alcohol dehydrogenase-like predicted oxidoreductase